MTKSTKTLAIRGVMFNWLGRGCSFVITFVATPIILSALGNEAYGLWAIVMSVGSYYALADVGMQAGCTKYIAEFEAKKDRDSTNRLLSTAILLYSIVAAVILLVACPVAWYFPSLFQIQEQSLSAVRWAVVLTGVSVAIRMQAQVFVATIKALKRFDVANGISVATQVVQAGLMIWAVLAGYGLLGMAWALVGTTLLSRLAEAYFAFRLLGKPKPTLWQFDRAMFRILFRFSSWSLLRNIASRFHTQSAPFIIGYLINPAAVAFFALANSIITKVHSLTSGVGSVIIPVASHLDAQKRSEALLRLMILSARLLVMMALITLIVVLFMGGSFIELWLGPGYAESVEPVLCILAFVFVADMISGGLNSVLTGMDRVDLVTKIKLIFAVVTVPLGIVFVSFFGVPGMAYALLGSSIVTNVLVCPYCTCRLVGYSWTRYLGQILLRPLLAAVPGTLMAYAATRYLTPSNLLEWFPMAGAIVAVMGLAAFFVCLDRETRADILSSTRFKRRKTKLNPQTVEQVV